MEAAEKLFRKALDLDPKFILAKDRIENLASSVTERWHFPMLNDRHRNEAYKTAICSAVKEGFDIALDLGTGTGLLSLMAVDAGAKRVFACEASEPMTCVAKSVLSINDAGGKVKLIQKLSLDMDRENDVTEDVLLLITETFDAGLLGTFRLYL